MADKKTNKARGYPKIMHGVGGHLTRKEANFLYDTPGRLGAGHYAELGTYLGRSALCIAGGIKDKNIKADLITVDMFDGRCLTSSKGKETLEQVQNRFIEKGVGNIVTAVKGLTAEMAKNYSTIKFNFIFIDADHSYTGCKADFTAWSPLIKSGGEIAFHDSDWNGVDKVLEEIKWPKRRIGTITVVTKP